MNRRHRKLQTLAIFMSVLIITIPFVFSQQLSVNRISGQDEVDGYARRGDTLSVVVTAAIFGNPPADIARTRVRLYSDQNRFVNFDTCAKQSGNFYECTLTDDEALRNVLGKHAYEIRLLDADGNTLETITRTITIDHQNPLVTDFSIDPAVSRDTTATFSYAAEDYAFAAGDTSDCSGIKEIQFIVDGQVITSETGSLQECVKSRSFTHDFSVNGTASFNVCAQATDFFDRKSNLVCSNFRVDNSGPRIQSADIVSSQGFTFTHVRSTQPVTATLSVLIEGDDNDIDQSSVTADLSALNPQLGVRRFDARAGDRYLWNNVVVSNPQNCEVTVNARDTIGNAATQTLTCEMPVDSTGPEVQDIRADVTDDQGRLVIPRSGRIVVEITDNDDQGDAGIGFQRNNVILDLQQLGLSRSERATNCTKLTDTWTCDFAIAPTVASGSYSIRLSSETRDDLDNLVTNTMNREVVFDKDPPEIVAVNRFDIIHEGVKTQNVSVQGDTIEVEITAAAFDTALGDFTDVGLEEITAIQCDTVNNQTETQRCLFSAVIEASGPYTADLTFTFRDLAGNEAYEILELNVLGIEDEENPNYWKVQQVECSPNLVDRSLTDLINYPVYCHIKLQPLLAGGGREKLPGVILHQLLAGGAAERAGLEQGDILLRYDGSDVVDVRDILERTSRTSPTETISIEYSRDGNRQTGQVQGGPLGSRFRTNRERIEGVKIIAADIADFATECTGDLSGFVSEIGMINNGVGSTNPIMSVRLATSDFNVENVTFSCPVRIFSQVGEKFTQNPELEDIPVRIQFYSQSLGEYANNVDKQVDRAVERAEDFLSWMDDIGTILEYAELICKAWNILVNVVTTLATVFAIFGGLELLLSVIPGAQAGSEAVKSAEQALCSPTEGIRKQISDSEYAQYVNKFCGFIECRYGLFDVTDAAGLTEGFGPEARSATTDFTANWLSLNYGDGVFGSFSQGVSANIKGESPTSDPDLNKGRDPSTYLNVKDSLVYSVVVPPLCIPGILHNLNKLRQIECRYALCMSRDVRNGLPVSVCKDAKHYQVCRFVTGEIFNVIPFAPIVSHYMGLLQNLLNDPLVLTATLIGYLVDCQATCSAPKGVYAEYIVCAGLYIADLVGKSVASIKDIVDNKDLIGKQSNQWCAELEDWQEDLEQKQQQGEPGATAFGGNQ